VKWKQFDDILKYKKNSKKIYKIRCLFS